MNTNSAVLDTNLALLDADRTLLQTNLALLDTDPALLQTNLLKTNKAQNECPFCSHIVPPVPELKWNPTVAAVLSLLVPGGGHIYKGKIIKGFLWTFFTAIGYGAYILPGIILHLLSISFAAMGNPLKV